MHYDLSVIITARCEEFLSRTVQGVLDNKRGNTEIIVVCDGNWPNPPLPDHKDVTIIYHNEPMGQRASINDAARLSKATWIMKLDAHCIVDEGFDIKLMADAQYDWTVIPTMYNLHAFDWVCQKCGNRTYQGPTPSKCFIDTCDGKCKRDIVWKPRLNRKSDFMRFDQDLHFQYWNEYKKRPEAQGEIADLMSFVGACFFLNRERYWELGGSEEEWGSWGQQGTEWACKTWLSGGRVVVNKKTWFSHLFRTQGGDFSFPYPQSQRQIEHARVRSKEFFKEGKWPGAKHTLDWLIKKFSPIPGWENFTSIDQLPKKKGIIYYTDNKLNLKIAHACQSNLKNMGLSIVSASLKPMPHMGTNIYMPLERGYLTMFKQTLAALEASDAEIVYFCEHDLIYNPSHFTFTPTRNDTYYYNHNWWRVRVPDGKAVTYDTDILACVCGYRELFIQHYKKKIERIEKGENSAKDILRMGFEPGTHNRSERIDDYKAEAYRSEFPIYDLRHTNNLTQSKWSIDDFRNKANCKDWQESNKIQILKEHGII